jgi:hypothetical protein
MKKIIFGLIAIVLFTNFSFSQTKSDFETFSVVSIEKTNFKNDVVKTFFEKTKINLIYPELQFNESETELLSLKNNFKTVKLSILNNEKTNIVYAVYNSNDNDFIWFFVNNTDTKIDVLSPEMDLISTFVNSNGFVNILNIDNRRSVFGACMDAVEDDYTNDFIGWAHWHSSPFPALTAAVACQGCAKNWWACPPAYLATLKK